MAQLRERDIDISLVGFLDPKMLREDPRTETNAQLMLDNYDYSVQGGHFFVLLMRFDLSRWLAIPLCSDNKRKRIKLDDNKKGGYEPLWKGVDSFYYPLQHWLIPTSAIIDASNLDNSPDDNRRSYALNDSIELQALSQPIVENTTPFHAPNPKPLIKSSN